MIASLDDLDTLLEPVEVGREAIGFDLGGFRSVVTRELLLIRMRRQAQVFGTGSALVAARLSADGRELEVDGAALMAANTAVSAQLTDDPESALGFLRMLARAERMLLRAAHGFGHALALGTPPLAALLAYVDANTVYQELGALKFCLPPDLRERVSSIVPGGEEALLAPERPSLWSVLRLRELALARARLRGSPKRYRRARSGFRRAHGYLGAEDVDFAEAEREDAIDARIAALGDVSAIEAAHAAMTRARAEDRSRRRDAAARFAEARPDATLVALVLLARVLAAHEDLNRRSKMRLLRDLRDLSLALALPIEKVGLGELARACTADWGDVTTTPWQLPQSC